MRFSIFILAICSAGCTTHRFLDRNTLKQTGTVAQFMQTQVLDNVARFANNRYAIPQVSLISSGTAQVTDTGSVTPNMVWNPFGFMTGALTGAGSRALMENWKVTPVASGGRVLRLQCAFQFGVYGVPFAEARAATNTKPAVEKTARVSMVSAHGPHPPASEFEVVVQEGCVKCIEDFVKVGILPAPCPNPDKLKCRAIPDVWKFSDAGAAQEYARRLNEEIDCRFPTQWFVLGSKKEAECCGCIYGSCGDTYAWVAPGKQDSFSRFTLTILAVAAIDPTEKTKKPKGEEDEDTGETKADLESTGARATEAMRTVDETRRQRVAAQSQRNAVQMQLTSFSEELPSTSSGAAAEWIETIKKFAEQLRFNEQDVADITKTLRDATVIYDEIREARRGAMSRLDSLDAEFPKMQREIDDLPTKSPPTLEQRQKLAELQFLKRQQPLNADQEIELNKLTKIVKDKQAEIDSTQRATNNKMRVLKRLIAELDQNEVNLRNAVDKAFRAVNKLAVDLANKDEDAYAIPDAFDRPSTLPFGNPLPGIEFQPLVPVP